MLGLVRLLRLVLALSVLRPILGCNGADAFCDLPLSKYTFPGTHNSNSYNLDIPEIIPDDIPGVDVNEVLRCFFENHDLSPVQQLNVGIRSFMVDLCDRPNTSALFNCHGQQGARAWGGNFADDVDGMQKWLTINQRELIAVAPDDMHTGSDGNQRWLDLMGSQFGGPCLEIGEATDVSTWSRRSQVSCAVLVGRPNDNVTMGALVNNNLRAVIFQRDWRSLFYSTYGDVHPGATSQKLLDDLVAYGEGNKPMTPNTLFLFQIFGSAKIPDFSLYKACPDPICKAAALVRIKDELRLDCVKQMATGFHTDLMQDDTHAHEFSTGEACPEHACGCLGYRSPIEVVHQKLLQNGHAVQSIYVDYPEVGERSSVAQVVVRMNEANLRHFRGEEEPGADWWSCHWQPIAAITVPLTMLGLCGLYLFLAVRYPKKYGVWFWKEWQAYQVRNERRKEGRARGREEARAYLHEDGRAGDMSIPQQIPPMVVAPSAGYAQSNGYAQSHQNPQHFQTSYQGNFQKFADTE